METVTPMNTLQSLLHDSLIVTGHVESCTLFKKDGTIKASSIGYEVDLHLRY